jgi:hypothetical protein
LHASTNTPGLSIEPGHVSKACNDHDRIPSSLLVIEIFGMLFHQYVKIGQHERQQAGHQRDSAGSVNDGAQYAAACRKNIAGHVVVSFSVVEVYIVSDLFTVAG